MMVRLQCLLQLCHLPLLALGILLPPRSLNFTSNNFKHILTWEEPNAESDIFYNVEYQTNYGPFFPVDNCTNITTRHCDLTKVFSRIGRTYSAQVQSFSSTERSDPSPPSPIFIPLTDTVVGPPIVDVVAAGSGINVSISLPISYLWNKEKQSFDSILTAYPAIDYTIELESSTKVLIYEEAVSLECFTTSVPLLYPSTTYCVVVSMESENISRSIPSPSKCVITEGSQREGNLLAPRNLNITSNNFKHILTWEELNNESDIFYNVEYQTNYGPFFPVDNCTNITTRHCDLTKVFSRIWRTYSARVQSFTSTERSDLSPPSPIFKPLTDTVVGPPIVDVVAAGNGINVSISLPVSYLWNKEKQSFDSILTAFPAMDYEIELESSTKVSIYKAAVSLESFTISVPSLYPSTTYCVVVSMNSENMYQSIPSPRKCVITEGSQVEGDKLYWIAAGVIFFILLLLLLIILDQTGYISKKKMYTPKVLESLPDSRSLLHRPDQLSPLCPMIYAEVLQSLENDHFYENPAGILGRAPYLAHNLNAENEHQQEALNQDNSLSSNQAPTREHSAGSLQDRTEMKLLEGSGVQVIMSIGDIGHPAVIPLSESSMEAPSKDAVGSSGKLLSNLANGFYDSLNLSLMHNQLSIDLNSVSLGASADLWTDVPMVASPKNRFNVLASRPNGDIVNISQFPLLCSVLDTDTPAMDSPHCENDETGGVGSDLNCASDYITR